MKRPVGYIIGGLAAAVLLVVIAGTVWIINTTAGARWLIGFFSPQTGMQISFRHIEGRLRDSLRLQGLAIKFPQVHTTIESLEVHFQPLYLLTGRLHFKNITVREAYIQDNIPEAPTVLGWPQASGLIVLINAKIESLKVSGFTYRHLNKEPLHVQTIDSALAWQNAVLSIEKLNIDDAAGGIRGKIVAGFKYPSLQIDATLLTAKTIAGMASFRLQSNLGPGQKQEQLVGSINLSGRKKPTDQQPLWELALDAGMTSREFHWKQFRLTRPGQSGAITGQGTLHFAAAEPFIDLRAKVADLDLTTEIKMPMNISGEVSFTGTIKQYQGRFTLANKGKNWQAIGLSSEYKGSSKGLKLTEIAGSLLDGALRGQLDLDWRDGLKLKGVLRGFNLNPARIEAKWQGLVNFNLAGSLSVSPGNILDGELSFNLLESNLHGQQLTGELQASLIRSNLLIKHLALQGKGFNLQAAGAIDKKLAFTAHIRDFSRLVPQTAGTLQAKGWTRRHAGRWSGAVHAQGGDLTAGDIKIATANLSVLIEDQDNYPLQLKATCGKLQYKSFTAETLTLQAGGTVRDHSLTAMLRVHRQEMHLTLAGSYHQGGWQGRIIRLSGTDGVSPWHLTQPAPFSITADSIMLEPMIFAAQDSESLKISAQLTGNQSVGFVTLTWNSVNLARADFWLREKMLTGRSSGNLHLSLLPQKRIALAGNLSARGSIKLQGQTISVQHSNCDIAAAEQGTRAALEIQLADGATVRGTFSSSSPARLALPDEGKFDLTWSNFALEPLGAWLPADTRLEGKFAGHARGRLLPDYRLDMKGQAELAQAKIHGQKDKKDVSISLRQTSLAWTWQENTLRGEMAASLAEYGQVRGNFQLPVPARFPVLLDQTGPLQVALTGQAREKGLLSSLFPGFIHESSGELDVNLKIDGTWREPLISGDIHLSKAGAYLPTAGITIKDTRLTAHLDQDTIRIKSFRALSGSGYIDGSASILLKRWEIVSYEGSINGERFQTIYLPELQLQSSPKLTFTGTPDQLSISGEVLLPYLQVTGSPASEEIKPSSDVVVAGRKKPAAKTLPVALHVQVKVVLGDQVFFKAAGIDAQLGGSIDLTLQDINAVSGRGEIKVVKGRYRTYGVNLDIVRGRLFYAGGPINQPTLDILALRTVGEVRAGVTVGGTLQTPVIKLYSEPAMQDIDILAYIVLGHPLGSSPQQAGPLALAAGALLSSRQAEDLQQQIKNRLGLSTLEIKTDQTESNSRMGYKPMQVGPAGTASASRTYGVTETMLVVGKYLTPQLYISYGRSLFSGGNLFSIRYDLSKRWQLESQTGQESGVDIYYKLEFN